MTATKSNWWPALIAIVVTVALMLWMAGWTGDPSVHRGLDALLVLAGALPFVVAWLAAACGFGWPLRRLLIPSGSDKLHLQVALGIAALLVLDAALGRIGFLQWRGSLGAWIVLAIGWALLLGQHGQWAIAARWQPAAGPLIAPPWLAWLAAPAIAVLLLAACSAPGWLWASEFGGYDALSYHLQLPKEWLALGRIQPVNHNVYSFLPGYVEAAYYHLAVLHGDGIGAVYACQLLHAALTLIAAAMVARFVERLAPPLVKSEHEWHRRPACAETRTGQRPVPLSDLTSAPAPPRVAGLAGAIAAVVFLGTPWVIVVGSLAYNEMATLLMLAAGLLLLAQPERWTIGRGVALGLLVGAACGAKLTALGFVALPLFMFAFAAARPRPRIIDALAGIAAGTLTLLPYFIGNWTSAGNPVFPFATDLFGTAHWTADQGATFAAAHAPSGSLAARLVELWNQWLRYGFGPNPDASGFEPWWPQWSILPWLALVGGIVSLLSASTRRWAAGLLLVLALQVAFWLFFTHLKSRFLLPTAVPCAALAALGINVVLQRTSMHRALTIMLAAAALAWSCMPLLLFRRERHGTPAWAIGAAALLAGDGLEREQAEQATGLGLVAVFLNHLLPADAKVLLIGDATPLYDRADVQYQTTWDRGPLSQAMREFPDDPQAWATALCRAGFTHVLLDAAMLERWQQSNWNDPLLTAQRVITMLEREGELLQNFPGGKAIYRLRCG